MSEYVVVDAFTDTPLQGNPVAVYLDGTGMSDAHMQAVAAEMHLSETTFVRPGTGDVDHDVRIFTPVNELPYAGHPLLGTAAALALETGRPELTLATRGGAVTCRTRLTGDAHAHVTMTQPVPTWTAYDADLCTALGIEASELPVEVYVNGPRHAIVTLPDVAALAALRPDHRALAEHPDLAVNCVAGQGTSWRNRMFSPAYGVVEDAATGSATGPVAIHLARHGWARPGRPLRISQGVELGRVSHMHVDVTWADGRPQGVQVSGDAVRVIRGRLSA